MQEERFRMYLECTSHAASRIKKRFQVFDSAKPNSRFHNFTSIQLQNSGAIRGWLTTRAKYQYFL